jgi:hypothetical protein
LEGLTATSDNGRIVDVAIAQPMVECTMFRIFHGIATIGNGVLCLSGLASGDYGMAAFNGVLSAWLITQQLHW